MDSTDSTSTDRPSLAGNRTVFVCGFVAKRWHNSSLQAIIQDLLPEYYIACNGETWDENTPTQSLLTNAEAMIFFVNEFTLGDKNCLLNLQYAWHLMVPVVMLRPPRTKLVINKREQTYDNIVIVDNGSIVRGPSGQWSLLDGTSMDTVDYALLQDVLHEGYKLSVVYDRLNHPDSMKKIGERLKQVMRPTLLHDPTHSPAFYLSPSNGPDLTERAYYSGECTTERGVENDVQSRQLRITRSMGNLERISPGPRTPYPRQNGLSNNKAVQIPPIETGEEIEENNSNGPHSVANSVTNAPSNTSRTSSRSIRRMSMGSLDDISGYQETQYLVFPIRNTSKKPTLIKFPEDLMEEDLDISIWGSDTSLDEDPELAAKLNGGLQIDDMDSPIGTPAPYIENL